VTAHLFFSHVHWDHIQGFPFFTPAFLKGNTFHLYGTRNVSKTIEETLAGQMDYPNFPVTLRDLAATMRFRDLAELEVVHLSDGAVRVFGVSGNHPNGVFAYRVEYQGHTLVYATDTEHYAVPDPKMLQVAQDADVFIYDAQYTPEEYAGEGGRRPRVGWGHSTMMEGAALSALANVGTLVLYHHDPSQDDAAVRDKERRARERFPRTLAAVEGLRLDVTRGRLGPEAARR
jgi:phosphoribosyl 1,2-cyclic phosphodiesterase